MSAGCSARKGYDWTFEERLEVRTSQSSGRRRVNCFGAVNPIKGEVIQMSSRESKSPAFVRFLRKIRLAYPRKRIWIYTDNLLAHRSRKTREFLEKHPAIELKFLPPYSPDLNPQEQWWRHERRKLLGNRCFGTPHEPATSLSWFVHNSEPEEVRGICSLTHIESLASGK